MVPVQVELSGVEDSCSWLEQEVSGWNRQLGGRAERYGTGARSATGWLCGLRTEPSALGTSAADL